MVIDHYSALFFLDLLLFCSPKLIFQAARFLGKATLLNGIGLFCVEEHQDKVIRSMPNFTAFALTFA